MGTTLIIAPHPDDEVLGCGGTIPQLVERGADIHVLIVTRGDELFDQQMVETGRREAREADRLLGVSHTHFADLPAIKIDAMHQYQVTDRIASFIHDIKPSTVFLPFIGDLNQDHQVVFNASMIAIRPGLSPVTEIYCYETASSTNWGTPGINQSFTPNVFFDISETINLKQQAFAVFESQTCAFPHPRSAEFIDALSRYRGGSSGLQHAEAFMLIRKVCQGN